MSGRDLYLAFARCSAESAAREGAARDRGQADECSRFRAGHEQKPFEGKSAFFCGMAPRALKEGRKDAFRPRRRSHWAQFGVGLQGGNANRASCGSRIPAPPPALAKCKTVQGMARWHHQLCLSLRFCGCGVISTGLSAAGCYLGIVAVVISVLESHAYVYGCV